MDAITYLCPNPAAGLANICENFDRNGWQISISLMTHRRFDGGQVRFVGLMVSKPAYYIIWF